MAFRMTGEVNEVLLGPSLRQTRLPQCVCLLGILGHEVFLRKTTHRSYIQMLKTTKKKKSVVPLRGPQKLHRRIRHGGEKKRDPELTIEVDAAGADGDLGQKKILSDQTPDTLSERRTQESEM